VLAWLPLEVTLGHVLYEDTFYYLKIAQHLVAGNGSTFGGVAPTNGYHPLWMVLSTGLATVFDGRLLVHALLTVAAVLHVAQALVIARILHRWTSPAITLAVTAFFLFNWRAIVINLCGLETPLAVLMVLIVVDRLMLERRRTELVRELRFGLLLGVAVLSRFDLLLLVGVAGLWVMLDPRYGGSVTRRDRLLAGSAVGAGVLAALMPWFVFSYTTSATLLPNSRIAVAMRAPVHYDLSDPAAFLATLKGQLHSLVHWASDSANFFGLSPWVAPQGRMAAVLGLAALAAGLAIAIYRARSHTTARLAAALLAYCVLHAGYYVVFMRAELRYVMPAAVVVLVAVGLVIHAATVGRRPALIGPAAAIVGITLFANTVAAGATAWDRGHAATRTHLYHPLLLEMALWVRDNTPPETVVGSWNAGIMGYFSERTVVNVDGVVNDDALRAMQSRTLDEYIAGRNVAVLVDVPREIDRYLEAWGGPNAAASLGRRLHVVEDKAGREIVAVRRRVDATGSQGR
jgi:hypothetical protein